MQFIQDFVKCISCAGHTKKLYLSYGVVVKLYERYIVYIYVKLQDNGMKVTQPLVYKTYVWVPAFCVLCVMYIVQRT